MPALYYCPRTLVCTSVFMCLFVVLVHDRVPDACAHVSVLTFVSVCLCSINQCSLVLVLVSDSTPTSMSGCPRCVSVPCVLAVCPCSACVCPNGVSYCVSGRDTRALRPFNARAVCPCVPDRSSTTCEGRSAFLSPAPAPVADHTWPAAVHRSGTRGRPQCMRTRALSAPDTCRRGGPGHREKLRTRTLGYFLRSAWT